MSDPENSGKTPNEVASFFQSWFFFRLLTDVLRMSVPALDFVRINVNGQSVITTKNLPEYIFRWINREQKLSPKAQEKYVERVNKALWHMHTIFNEWWLFANVPFDPWIALSLRSENT
jgi:hypothetical protein